MALGTVRDSLIKCIFFCEFHPTAGPKIMYQVGTCSLHETKMRYIPGEPRSGAKACSFAFDEASRSLLAA